MNASASEKAPVILIIYNRPDLTQKILTAISQYRPDRLYIIADGPKNKEDNELCTQTRSIVEKIDWDCVIRKNYSKVNLGCGKRISSGISWAFESCDRAIILEDDCLPAPGFFDFCERLLDFYKFDERVGMISGNSFVDASNIEFSYYFSCFPHMWGWATWKRVWANFDLQIEKWPNVRDTKLIFDKTGSSYYAQRWMNIFDCVFTGQIDTWAYPFVLMFWLQNYLSIVPKENLVSNIGFNERATHTKNSQSVYSNSPLGRVELPLSHPQDIMRDFERDFQDLLLAFGEKPNIRHKVKRYLKNKIKDCYAVFCSLLGLSKMDRI